MSSRRTHSAEHWKRELVHEAARLMADSGIESFELAKRKARERLHLPAGTPLPRNHEIEAALIEYRQLFGGEQHDECLRHLRQAALQAMRALAPFRPRLVGPVLSGAGDEHSTVCLHLFADAAEDVAFFLIDLQIPFRHTEQRMRMSSGVVERLPGYAFGVDDVAMQLLVFSGKLRRQAPISPVDGRPMRRASVHELCALMDSTQPELP